MGIPVTRDARSGTAPVREPGPAGPACLEVKIRETIARGLPKLATTALAGAYPTGFMTRLEPCRDRRISSQVVASQLLYTRNLQLLALLIMEPGDIMKLGRRLFSGMGRTEGPRMVVSANAEVLNTMVSKLSCLVGRMDGDANVAITPPVILNCSGDGGILLRGSETLLLSLGNLDVSLLIAVCLQAV